METVMGTHSLEYPSTLSTELHPNTSPWHQKPLHFPILIFPTLLLLLSCFSSVRLCVIPKTAAHQAPPSLGFSRQEWIQEWIAVSYSRGFFPPRGQTHICIGRWSLYCWATREVQNVCVCVCVLVTQLCPALWDPMNYSPPDSSFHCILYILQNVEI